jgi:transcriptional regulator with XRE-family HTH domain
MSKIKELRQKTGMTQAEFGAKIGAKQSTVAMWETGGRNPRFKQLRQIAMVLNCTIDELIAQA